MISAMKDIQSTYGGGNITQPQLEAVFRKWLPTPSASCNARLTAVLSRSGGTRRSRAGGANTLNRPMLTGPGLNGQGFPCAKVTPAAPNGENGWYTTDVDVDWSGFPTPAATITATRTGCGDASGHESITTDGTFTPSCEVSSTVTATGANAGTSGPISETIKRDATPPVVTYTGGRTYTVDETVVVDCSATDPTPGSGLDSTTCADVSGPAYTFALGDHTLSATATDVAGQRRLRLDDVHDRASRSRRSRTSSRGSARSANVTKGLNDKLDEAAKAKNGEGPRQEARRSSRSRCGAQSGKAFTAEQAQILIELAEALK